MKKFVLPLLFAGCCFAGELSVKVTTDKADAIYKSGDTVVVTAVALEDGKPVSGRTVTYANLLAPNIDTTMLFGKTISFSLYI